MADYLDSDRLTTSQKSVACNMMARRWSRRVSLDDLSYPENFADRNYHALTTKRELV